MSALGKRIGFDRAARLMTRKRHEERLDALGLREPDEPSKADFDIQRALMRSEFTPQERERIRYALGIDPVADIGPLPGFVVPVVDTDYEVVE